MNMWEGVWISFFRRSWKLGKCYLFEFIWGGNRFRYPRDQLCHVCSLYCPHFHHKREVGSVLKGPCVFPNRKIAVISDTHGYFSNPFPLSHFYRRTSGPSYLKLGGLYEFPFQPCLCPLPPPFSSCTHLLTASEASTPSSGLGLFTAQLRASQGFPQPPALFFHPLRPHSLLSRCTDLLVVSIHPAHFQDIYLLSRDSSVRNMFYL